MPHHISHKKSFYTLDLLKLHHIKWILKQISDKFDFQPHPGNDQDDNDDAPKPNLMNGFNKRVYGYEAVIK